MLSYSSCQWIPEVVLYLMLSHTDTQAFLRRLHPGVLYQVLRRKLSAFDRSCYYPIPRKNLRIKMPSRDATDPIPQVVLQWLFTSQHTPGRFTIIVKGTMHKFNHLHVVRYPKQKLLLGARMFETNPRTHGMCI